MCHWCLQLNLPDRTPPRGDMAIPAIQKIAANNEPSYASKLTWVLVSFLIWGKAFVGYPKVIPSETFARHTTKQP